jgi:hypothetical protein
MSQAKIIAGVVVTCLLSLLVSWGFQVYSVPDPWKPYTRAVRGYLGAGLHGDSAALAARAASRQPAVWVQDAIRRHPATVAAWAQQLNTVTGFRRGETVTVALTSAVEGCSHLSSVTAQLLNHSAMPRVLTLSSPCTRSDLPPLLPYQRRW